MKKQEVTLQLPLPGPTEPPRGQVVQLPGRARSPAQAKRQQKQPRSLWYALYLPQLAELPGQLQQQRLEQLAELATGVSSRVSLHPCSLVFEIRSSLRYFGGSVPTDTALSVVYLLAVYIGHHVLLTVVPLFLLATPLIVLFPRRKVMTVLAVVLFAAMIALMMLDSLLWSQSRFHINALTAKILGWQSLMFAGVIFAVGVFFESMLARSVWNFVLKPKRRRGGLVASACALCIVLSQGIHAWADAAYYVPVTSLGQMLPVYKGVTAKSFMSKTGLVDIAASRERELARRVSLDMESTSGRLLDYPKSPLQCSNDEPLNLLFIVVDSLRGDVVTPELAPHISRFASQQAMDFRNHFSGGNSSRMGMFSLIYGLPPRYWSSISS